MSRTRGAHLLGRAAVLISRGTTAEIASVWNITDRFAEARGRVLPGEHTKPARTYLQLLDALVGVGTSNADDDLFDSALLSVCLAVGAGLEQATESELDAAVERLFSPPLARENALDALDAMGTRDPSRC